MATNNNLPYEKFPDDDQAKETVYPCCCPIEMEKFFFGFTIFIIVTQSLNVINSIIDLVNNPASDEWVGLAITIGILIWAILILVNYKKTGEYGTKSAYILSIVFIIGSVLVIILVIAATIVLLVFKNNIFSEIKEFKPIYIVIGSIAALIILGYMVYLNILYHICIKTRRGKLGI